MTKETYIYDNGYFKSVIKPSETKKVNKLSKLKACFNAYITLICLTCLSVIYYTHFYI